MELYAPCSPQGEVKFRVRLGMLLLPRLKPFGGVNVVNDVIEAVVVYYFRYVGSRSHPHIGNEDKFLI